VTEVRIAIAKYGQETNSFSSTLTTLDTFRKFGLYQGSDFLQHGVNAGPIAGLFAACQDQAFSWEPIPLVRGWAGASGKITEETHDWFVNNIVTQLANQMNVTDSIPDALFLDLHGAAQSVHLDDCEGELIAQCRDVLGKEIPIVVALDHHANLTEKMVGSASAIVAHRTQPHDPFDTGYQAGKMLVDILQGQVNPIMALEKIPMLTHQEQFLTSPAGPMQEWFQLARDRERVDGVLAISPCPMQPWLDTSEAGWGVVVVTDGDKSLAQEIAEEMAWFAWENRSRFMKQTSVPPELAVEKALHTDGFVILSDTGDSVFGGAPGDSTVLLKALMDITCEQDCLIPMVDPEVVQQAYVAGEGALVAVEIGGKQDCVFSQPVAIECEVVQLGGGRIEVEVIGNDSYDAGQAVLLRWRHILLAVTETEGVGGNHPVCYEQFGVDVNGVKLAVLKTASNFQYYRHLSPTIIRADSNGMTMSGVERLPWKSLSRPIFPLDDEVKFG